ncbi:MAG TPA: hypothetical protein VMS43_17580 [Allosphingosinicella sp.]|nr:hypothetical protein [Allosphingosinicella sp.]
MAGALGTAPFERIDDCHLRLRDGDLAIDFYWAARIHEIGPSITLTTSSGCERLPLDAVQEWLGEAPHAYMFSDATMRQACGAVADFAERVITGFRRDPAAAVDRIYAIGRARADRYEIEETRRAANEAWTRRDLPHAARLYEKIADRLSAVERKRLSLAKRNPA